MAKVEMTDTAKPKKFNARHITYCLAFTLGIVFLIYYPSLGVGFDTYLDDWEIIERFQKPEDRHDQVKNVRYNMSRETLAETISQDVNQYGRARPIYWTIRFFAYEAFGTNPLGWHISSMTALFITVSSIFGIVYLLGNSLTVSSISGIAFAIFNRNYENYVAVSHAETWAVVFLALGIFLACLCIVIEKNSLLRSAGLSASIVFFVLGALCKESILLAIPAGACIVALNSQELVKNAMRNWKYFASVICICGLLCAAFLIVSQIPGDGSYGGSFTKTKVSSNRIKVVQSILSQFVLTVQAMWPLVITILLGLIFFRKKMSWKRTLILVGVMLLGVAPQVLIYSSKTFPCTYYFIILSLVIVLVNGCLLSELIKQNNRIIYFLIVFIACIQFYKDGRQTTQVCAAAAASTRAYDEMIDIISKSSVKDTVIIIPGTMIEVFEPGRMILSQVTNHGRSDLRLRWIPKNEDGPLQLSTINDLEFRPEKDKVGVVTSPTRNPSSLELGAKFARKFGLTRKETSGMYHVWSWRSLAWSERKERFVFWIREPATVSSGKEGSTD